MTALRAAATGMSAQRSRAKITLCLAVRCAGHTALDKRWSGMSAESILWPAAHTRGNEDIKGSSTSFENAQHRGCSDSSPSDRDGGEPGLG